MPQFLWFLNPFELSLGLNLVWHPICFGGHRPTKSNREETKSCLEKPEDAPRSNGFWRAFPREEHQMDARAGRDDRVWLVIDVGDEAMGLLGSVMEDAGRHRVFGRGIRMRGAVSSPAGAEHRHRDGGVDLAVASSQLLGDSLGWD